MSEEKDMSPFETRELWGIIKDALGLPNLPADKLIITLQVGHPVRMDIEGFAPSAINDVDWSKLPYSTIHVHVDEESK